MALTDMNHVINFSAAWFNSTKCGFGMFCSLMKWVTWEV